ncbi:MAG: hypothetical protein LN415_05305 [Candidatus Thermoplasmatota archaeon]|nr:hypothetical protein [Candidatus Thermoplasmatota archaeon]
MRGYYQRKTRKKPSRKGWKSIIDELLTEREPGKLKYRVKRTLMGHLDFVRENRNMVEHPDRIFSKREAESLFLQVAATITDVVQDMKKKGRQAAST